jgi:glycogen(starch) synthase
LVEALRHRIPSVETLAAGPDDLPGKAALWRRTAAHAMRCLRAGQWDLRAIKRSFAKSPAHFRFISARTAANVRRRETRPDFVLHVFGLSAPWLGEPEIPYAFYLDYTTALAKRHYPGDALHLTPEDGAAFIEAERRAYAGATHLFAMSAVVARSLTDDYHMDPSRVHVVGSGGNFERPYEDTRTFGSKRLLFNASDFARKGGELVLEAWPLIRKAEPAAELVTVGRNLPRAVKGVRDLGPMRPTTLAHLFLGSDLVLSPALHDPFPGFVIEAMNYGTPVVVSANDGMPEIVGDDAGIVLGSRSPLELAETVVGLLRDEPRLRALSIAARRRVAERLNWDVVAEKVVRVLRGAA